ncbi:DEAD/DEAH box helicase [Sulfobacillus thermosulfidooxidans]|uniref:DEAD/DEAH box helicase n=1 Tax=Sulfobacillus thermosulfidooxidans TaxID=28034 RepID=UPI0006B48747|nr:DEAD/DEAH box helicase [Sulfobacillus thermosulfidooxidans]
MSQVSISVTMSPQDIINRIGSTFYQRGMQYVKAHRVVDIREDSLSPGTIHATVQGSAPYHVQLTIDPTGYFREGSCTCPAFWQYGGCKHIAAVLIALSSSKREVPETKARSNSPSSAKPASSRLVRQFFESFRAQDVLPTASPSSKETLRVQFFLDMPFNIYDPIFTLEMKVGNDQHLYVIPKLAQFLEDIQAGRAHVFTKRFTYNPKIHQFRPEDWAVIDLLLQILSQFDFFRQQFYISETRYSLGSERKMPILPVMWPKFLPLWPHVEVFWALAGQKIEWSPDPLPLVFRLNAAQEGEYLLSFDKPQATILPEYACAVAGSTIYPLAPNHAKVLHQLLNLPSTSSHVQIPLSQDDVEQVVTTILPSLEQLGTLQIAPEISSQIISDPLQPRIYLDWDGDQIQALLHYVYGPSVIVHGDLEREHSQQIIHRDRVQEAQCVAKLLRYGFVQDESQFLLTDEDAIYEFMQTGLKELKTWADVHISEAFAPVYRPTYPPKLRLDTDAEKSWLDVSFDCGDLAEDDVRQLLRSLKEKRRYHRLTDGRLLSLEEEHFQATARVIDQLDVDPVELSEKPLTLSIVQAVPLIDADPTQQASLSIGKSLRRWLDDLRHPDNLDITPPKSLQATLRDYQVTGFLWMKMLSQYRFGGVLADDMGLGKTLQSIAYLLSERESNSWHHPALVVAPASLIYNWHHELAMFAPSLRTLVVAGDPQDRQRQWKQADEEMVDVFITSYPLLRRDRDYYRDQMFHAVIFDEAQTLKNAGTQVAQAASHIKSPRRFALTGTPLENSLNDLWSIFHIIFPELLGSRQKFSRMKPEQVARRVRPFILRRLKHDVLKELPDKIESVQTTELNREQKKVYLAYLEKVQTEARKELEQAGFQKSRIKILSALTRLRQICCHPGLFLENYEGESAKLDLLIELVDEALQAGHHLLIFSQFTSMLALMAQAFDQRQWPYFLLDGNTPAQERLHLVNRFNQKERSIFLISLKAGGTGLNLTGADTVILYDLWWNPAVESQATDRAHRIGQKNVVQVIRLITQGTIEEKIYALQQKKRDLIDQVINPQGEDLPLLSEDDIREILQL